MRDREESWSREGLLHIEPEDRLLVVAPHADDESIGCGGLLLKYAAQTDCLLISDGRFGFNRSDPDASPEKTRLLRREEFQAAMAFLKVRDFTMLDLLNGEVYRHYAAVRDFDVTGYDYIFVPSRYENNQDHLHTRSFLRRMIREQHARAVLIEYEVWVPIPEPSVVLDIGDVAERKRELVGLYASQLECYDYVRLAEGLGLYRGARFKRGHVEAFFVPPKGYYLKKLVRALTTYSFRNRIKSWLHRS